MSAAASVSELAPNIGRGGRCGARVVEGGRLRATANDMSSRRPVKLLRARTAPRAAGAANAESATGGHTEQPVLSTSDWVSDLSAVFGWGFPGERREKRPTVVLDGANIAWAYGQALAKRFKCKAYPCSQGLLLAMHYETWKANGVAVRAVMPMSYVQGPLDGLADGCGGVMALVNPDKVTRLSSDLWRNDALWTEYQAGRLQLVKRPPTEQGRAEDDLTVLRVSREVGGGFVCSNDFFRQHYRARAAGRTQKDGAQLFQNKRRFAQWNSMRHFGLRFNVAPGLSDEMLAALWRSVGLLPPAEEADDGSAEVQVPPPGWDRIKFWDLGQDVLPVYFGPEPNMQMLVAWKNNSKALLEE